MQSTTYFTFLKHFFINNADYVCDNEDEAIITSIGHPAEDHVLVRVDDVFVDYKTFKCLLRRQAYVYGDVSTIYMICFL
jgi:hypothetical protein